MPTTKYGYNFVTGKGNITWNSNGDVGHGTHVAGTVAAVNGNSTGVCGIAGGDAANPGCKIMSCQIFAGNNVATTSATAKAIKYAADNGAVILQCSWDTMAATSSATASSPRNVRSKRRP